MIRKIVTVLPQKKPGLTGLTGFTCFLLKLRQTLSNINPLSAETKISVRVAIGFVPFPACPQVERHKNPGNPVNPVPKIVFPKKDKQIQKHLNPVNPVDSHLLFIPFRKLLLPIPGGGNNGLQVRV